ncbi:class I SAM-dependent methyltransferase [Streptomyces sp. RB6PN25]|uniref:S-adenosyl-L-methionine-dependent methyltransferase n=1 Tax=Streptomyces humicola TaxID=2953240 RepID=A0ABT1PQ46_9ACTN|nr:class I SAM-dependent methyltransferase [Streptomyces humicola]MCQ4079797.1 class I SAM-dependent methyltransferase [Streptomyces humicola]
MNSILSAFAERWLARRPGPTAVRPSRTSQAVALTRAELSRPHSPDGDPDAQRHLCAGMRSAPPPWLRPQLAARTRFFDEHVTAGMGGGIRQIVVLGAGYDDRSLRFRTTGVRFFEVDHPATQTDKARRLRALRARADEPVLAAADFREDDVPTVLGACGHDPGERSLFICEGLLVYLEQPVIVRLLTGLRACAPSGSVLAASLAVHEDGLDSAEVAAAANARRRSGAREPWRTILPADAHLELFTRAGWSVEHAVDAVELDDGVRPGRCLLVTAG